MSRFLAEERVLLQKLRSSVQHPGTRGEGREVPYGTTVPPGTAASPKSARIPSLPNAKNCSLCFLPETGQNGGVGKPQQSNAEGKSPILQGCCGGGWRRAPCPRSPVLMGAHTACATQQVPSATTNVLLIISD